MTHIASSLARTVPAPTAATSPLGGTAANKVEDAAPDSVSSTGGAFAALLESMAALAASAAPVEAGEHGAAATADVAQSGGPGAAPADAGAALIGIPLAWAGLPPTSTASLATQSAHEADAPATAGHAARAGTAPPLAPTPLGSLAGGPAMPGQFPAAGRLLSLARDAVAGSPEAVLDGNVPPLGDGRQPSAAAEGSGSAATAGGVPGAGDALSPLEAGGAASPVPHLAGAATAGLAAGSATPASAPAGSASATGLVPTNPSGSMVAAAPSAGALATAPMSAGAEAAQFPGLEATEPQPTGAEARELIPEGSALMNRGLSGPEFVNARAEAAPVHRATLSSAPHEAAFAGDLSAEVRLLVGNGLHKAELRLNPAELGPIHIQLSISSQTADISFAAAHNLTREGITQSLPALREMLASQGLSLGEAGVSAGQGGQASQDPGRERRSPALAPAGAQATASEAVAAATGGGRMQAGRGMLDLYA